ncbi:UDP-N-acetylenolpyruvoylglucosamine reductase [Candidatus Kaiserbacteria bacterium RIFOXYB1_FULL_46_14]|uniref:UDP-N-acetylenolpyruvoylglucosamine reductase n=1 Tax=Candidatus Kaiserbacteria bacterium RIFOXYB1_FULL_46_14 TaxID=1798531 RepID=A0A1F6FHY5_9BACT|nr:MAG: UDP-N-acetylenolpyruvoylglucosamine reductase [Candidatus Kaiserbacteria bacterium RIFOXYB1_FULL_46_14]
MWKEDVSLAPYTTLKVGGKAKYFAVVKNEEELKEVCSEARRLDLPVLVLGGGSNLLISDEGIDAVVIKNEIEGILYQELDDEVLVTAGGGEVWDDLVSDIVGRNLWGLENLSAIPGTVGATPIQNVGAYGVEAGELIESVRVYDIDKDDFITLSVADCHFAYRDSFFKTAGGRRNIIVSVTYRLSKKPRPRLLYKDLAEYFKAIANPSLQEVRQAIINTRAGKFPDWTKVGTAGSFFKNPIISSEEAAELVKEYPTLPVFVQEDGRAKISLGYILDKICGLRGLREGDVGLYEKQALILVNYGGASALEIKEFVQKISDAVFEKTKIKIEQEVNCW